jgi:thiol reductant ABC exporter CydD subunit
VIFDRRLLPGAGPVRRDLGIAVGLGVVSAGLVLVQAAGLAYALEGVFLKGRTIRELVPALLGIALAALARAAAAYGTEVAAQRAAAEAKCSLRTRLSRRIVERGPLWTVGERAGELAHTLVGGVEATDAYVAQYLPQLALSVLVPLLVLAAVAAADPVSALVLFLTYPLIPLFMGLIGSVSAVRTRRQWLELSRLGATFLDVVQGLPTLKALGAAGAAVDGLAASGERLRRVTLGVLRVAFLSALVLELVATLGTALLAVEIGLRLLYGRLDFAPGLFVLVLAPEFYRPLRALGSAYHAGMAGAEASQRIHEVLEARPPAERAPGEALVVARAPGPAGPGEAGPPGLIFDRVRARYSPDLSPALDGVSFRIDPGTTVALLGPSGSGKSTVANLLLRFLDPVSGEIVVDSVPLPLVDAASWRKRLAWVPQRPHLFHGTVLDNIRLGRPEATAAQVAEAARLADATAFIDELPDGLHTQLGEGGQRLSGGQAQRVALARAFLKDVPLVVLDEPTAHLDPDSEDRLLPALHRLREGRTVLLIAHRLRTALDADRVVLLSRGRVEEAGVPRELRERGGPFARLVASFEAGS